MREIANQNNSDYEHFLRNEKYDDGNSKMNLCFKIVKNFSAVFRTQSNSSKNSSWWTRLEDVFRLRLQKTFWRRLQDALIKTNMFALALRLQKTSWSRPIYSSWPYVFKTSSRRFQNVFKTSSRRFQDVLSS